MLKDFGKENHEDWKKMTIKPYHASSTYDDKIYSILFSVVETLAELRDRLKEAIQILTETDSSTTSISSAGELFLRFITLTSLEHPVNITDILCILVRTTVSVIFCPDACWWKLI